MRYEKMEVFHCDIDNWWIAHKRMRVIFVNNNFRPKFKMKLTGKGKNGK